MLSSGGSGGPDGETLLERLKNDDKIKDFACQLVARDAGLSKKQKNDLANFFVRDPELRTSDFKMLISLLGQQVSSHAGNQRQR